MLNFDIFMFDLSNFIATLFLTMGNGKSKGFTVFEIVMALILVVFVTSFLAKGIMSGRAAAKVQLSSLYMSGTLRQNILVAIASGSKNQATPSAIKPGTFPTASQLNDLINDYNIDIKDSFGETYDFGVDAATKKITINPGQKAGAAGVVPYVIDLIEVLD
jgi:type II secretory pathway pseudopilin PulG